MDISRILVCVLLMALVTYLPRMLPLAIFKKKIQHPFVRSFLAYIPYAILAAMTFPEILFSTSHILSAIAGLAVALLLAYMGKRLLTVAVSAVAAVFIAEQLLSILHVLN